MKTWKSPSTPCAGLSWLFDPSLAFSAATGVVRVRGGNVAARKALHTTVCLGYPSARPRLVKARQRAGLFVERAGWAVPRSVYVSRCFRETGASYGPGELER